MCQINKKIFKQSKIKIECIDFISVEKVRDIVIAFSNHPGCEFAFTNDDGLTWDKGLISRYSDEIISSPWQTCSDELGFIFAGTSRGNIYRGKISVIGIGWWLVNDTSFADDDAVLYFKIMADSTIFAVSKSGYCIRSIDRGLTWEDIKVTAPTLDGVLS